MPAGSAPGERRGGRQKGGRNKATVEREHERAEALAHATARVMEGTDVSAVRSMRAVDVMRTAMRIHADAGNWDKASAWAKEIAPYETAKLAPKPEEAAAETDEERAYRMRSAVTEMRKAAVGDDEAGEAVATVPEA